MAFSPAKPKKKRRRSGVAGLRHQGLVSGLILGADHRIQTRRSPRSRAFNLEQPASLLSRRHQNGIESDRNSWGQERIALFGIIGRHRTPRRVASVGASPGESEGDGVLDLSLILRLHN